MKTTSSFVFVLIAIGLFYTFISPHYEKVKALQAEANTYSNVLDNVETLTEKRDELLVKYNAIPKDEVTRVEKTIPDNVDTVSLALDFDTIASRYGITIKNIKTVDTPNGAGDEIIQPVSTTAYKTTTVVLNFVSTYDNFRKFMKDIESSLRIIDVKTVNFTSNDNSLYEFSVSIETYSLK